MVHDPLMTLTVVWPLEHRPVALSRANRAETTEVYEERVNVELIRKLWSAK